ncbi:WRKY DNA-binding transcription factor 70-like isoform X2 [Primulina huaijiensis]|uniref:WRKY DNA-binding transcription factor 70-like isoform X2 n=1 Tax=Primulina huaijiensis TaxID=1492673 RepID=UPI003CC77665
MEKRLMEELLAGKNSAIQLQTLLHNPDKDEGSVSREELAMKILRSFINGISIASSCTAVLPAQISAVDCVGGSGSGSACSGEGKKKVVKDKRGCYKRKTSDSWIKVSPTVEDGGAWRKYGQKHILNSNHPRCYYRCTHKSQGCKAKKQVQKIKDDPMYQITYFDHHTCTDTQMMLPQHIVESDPIESNLLSFQRSIHSLKPANVSLLKQEFEVVDTQSVDLRYAKSSVNTSSQVIIGSGSSTGCKQVFSPRIPVPGDDLEEEVSGLYSCASMNSFHGLDMEVDQLGDIDFEQWCDVNFSRV